MAQAKKSAQKVTKFTPSSSNKVQNFTAIKAPKAVLAAVESSSASAEDMLKMGSESAREWVASSAEELQKAQEKLFAIGRETADKLTRSTDSASETISEFIEQGKENMNAVIELCDLTAGMSKTFSSEAFNFINSIFADNVEMSKELFTCRTANDLFEIQSRMFKVNTDNLLSQSMKMSEMVIEYANEAAEPINERVSEATQRITKALTQAA